METKKLKCCCCVPIQKTIGAIGIIDFILMLIFTTVKTYYSLHFLQIINSEQLFKVIEICQIILISCVAAVRIMLYGIQCIIKKPQSKYRTLLLGKTITSIIMITTLLSKLLLCILCFKDVIFKSELEKPQTNNSVTYIVLLSVFLVGISILEINLILALKKLLH